MQNFSENPEFSVHVLIVDGEKVSGDLGEPPGWRCSVVNSASGALELLERDQVDLIIADVEAIGSDVAAFVRAVKERCADLEVLLLARPDAARAALEGMKTGAADYLQKPYNADELRLHAERALQKMKLSSENRLLRQQGPLPSGFGRLLGATPAMQKLFRSIIKVSQNHHPVLIAGESGTGKELVARSLHDSGPLHSQPFLAIECTSLVPSLIESELFGYVRGAFTGATRDKEGLLAAARAGTVFLDEIGDLPLEMQGKLLRAIQEKEIRPVGGTRSIRFEARILAATNRNLEQAVRQGSFRKDLYYRLNVVTLGVPPLRERKADIPLLVDFFLQKYWTSAGPPPALSTDALNRLLSHDWPGNVRELENCVERAVALSSGPILQLGDLPTNVQRPLPEMSPADYSAGHVLPLREMERQAILRAVREAGGDKLLAARRLGIGKTTLYRKLKEYQQE
jgi:DNA-binding NtrC family response regulator